MFPLVCNFRKWKRPFNLSHTLAYSKPNSFVHCSHFQYSLSPQSTILIINYLPNEGSGYFFAGMKWLLLKIRWSMLPGRKNSHFKISILLTCFLPETERAIMHSPDPCMKLVTNCFSTMCLFIDESTVCLRSSSI